MLPNRSGQWPESQSTIQLKSSDRPGAAEANSLCNNKSPEQSTTFYNSNKPLIFVPKLMTLTAARLYAWGKINCSIDFPIEGPEYHPGGKKKNGLF